MPERVIFHIDVNSAFLSWEAVYRLNELGETVDLREIPSAIGGDMSKRHGVVLAKSTPAKQYNIRTGEPIVDALKKCPDLMIVQPNHELYTRNSRAFMEILRKYSPVVEQYSIDEAFMDMTGTQLLFGEPVEAAHRIKDEIYNTLGFTVNVGISSNKLLAKMAGDFEKPNKVHTLFPHEIVDKMWPLPVGDLLFVGKSTVSRLRSMGIRTIGELANTDISILRGALKKQGEAIWHSANGHDDSMLELEPEDNKGYGNSTTLEYDVVDADAAKHVLLFLSENVCRRLRKDGVRAGEVSVSIRYNDLSRVSHQCTLSTATNITREVYENSCKLFDELWDGTPIRLLGVRTGKVSRDGVNRQMSLFDNTDYEKLEKLDKAVDKIREKFGMGAIKPASFITENSKKEE